MKIKQTKEGKKYIFTDSNLGGYNRWQNVGTWDEKTLETTFFDGKWFKRLNEAPDAESALKLILKHYKPLRENYEKLQKED